MQDLQGKRFQAQGRVGGRVSGHGKGIYDRLLKDTQTPAIGVVFDYQVFESVPMEPHDRRLDKVVTERRVIVRKTA